MNMDREGGDSTFTCRFKKKEKFGDIHTLFWEDYCLGALDQLTAIPD